MLEIFCFSRFSVASGIPAAIGIFEMNLLREDLLGKMNNLERAVFPMLHIMRSLNLFMSMISF